MSASMPILGCVTRITTSTGRTRNPPVSGRDVPSWEQWAALTPLGRSDFGGLGIRSGPDSARDVLAYIAEVESRHGRTARYKRVIKSRGWRELREQAKERSGACCERCGVRGTSRSKPDTTLHLHHLSYERLGKERLEDVVLLCARCHRLEHGVELNDEPDGCRRGRGQGVTRPNDLPHLPTLLPIDRAQAGTGSILR